MIIVFVSVWLSFSQLSQYYKLMTAEKLTDDFSKSFTGGYIDQSEFISLEYDLGSLGIIPDIAVMRYNEKNEYPTDYVSQIQFKYYSGIYMYPLQDKDLVIITLHQKDTVVKKTYTIHGTGVRYE